MTDKELAMAIRKKCNELSVLMSEAAAQGIEVQLSVEKTGRVTGYPIDEQIAIPLIRKIADL
jgi:hypothetical protein